jgi:hypothetical protein
VRSKKGKQRTDLGERGRKLAKERGWRREEGTGEKEKGEGGW